MKIYSAFFIAFILLSICHPISYDMVQTINDDGSSLVKLTVDYADHFNSLNITKDDYVAQLTASCSNMCNVNGLRVTYERQFINGTFYEFTQNQEYLVQTTTKFKLDNLPVILPIISHQYSLGSPFFDTLQAKDVSFTYKVVMPSDVSYAPGGDIKNKRVSYDLLNTDEISVEIYEYDIFKIVLILSILVFAYFLLNGSISYLGYYLRAHPKEGISEYQHND